MTQHSAEPQAWAEGGVFTPSQLIDALKYAVSAADLDGQLVVWNRGAEQLFGYPAEQMLGRDVYDIAPTIESSFADIKVQLQTGAAWSGTALIQHYDGDTLVVGVTHTPIQGAHGELV